MVNGTLLNFGKRQDDNLKVIFDQWVKLDLGLDALCNQKILKGIYYTYTLWNEWGFVTDTYMFMCQEKSLITWG